jgi:hypothetical protein
VALTTVFRVLRQTGKDPFVRAAFMGGSDQLLGIPNAAAAAIMLNRA